MPGVNTGCGSGHTAGPAGRGGPGWCGAEFLGQAGNVADRRQADQQTEPGLGQGAYRQADWRADWHAEQPVALLVHRWGPAARHALAGWVLPVWPLLLASTMLAVAPHVHAAPRQAGAAAPAVQDVARSDGLHAQPVTGVQADTLPRVADVAPALFLPADTGVGLAAFWSGPELMVVVDHALPALFHLPAQGGLFDRRESVALNGATLLRLYLPEHPAIVVERQKAGWLLCVAGKGAPGRCSPPHDLPVAQMQPEPARMLFAQSQPGRVITLPDPVTGGRLFVATTRQAEQPPPPRAGVGYAVRPSVLGLVVAADSAQLLMTATPAGPVLEALAAEPVPVGLPALPPSASVQQGEDWLWLGLRDAPAPQLLQAWRKARDSLGTAGEDPATRLAGQPEAAVMSVWSARIAAAQAAFAAGYPQQAWALLRDLPLPAGQAGAGAATAGGVAHAGWPGPGVQALRACAALLSADMAGAAPLATADWAFEPDMVVWRGAYFMASGADSQPTSVLLARGYARLEQYPAPVRAWLLLRVSQYLAEFGGPDERAALGTLPDDAPYNLARIMLQLRNGQAETARVALENLTASGNDRVADHARALLVAFLRAHDQISPDMAVEAYAQLLAAQAAEGGASSTAAASATSAVQEDADLLPPLRLAYAQALAQAGQPERAAGVLDGLVPSATLPHDKLVEAWRSVLSGLIFGPPQSPHTAPVRAGTQGGKRNAVAQVPATGVSGPARGQMLALARARMGQVPDDPFKAKLLAGLGRQFMAQGRPGLAVAALQQADVLAIDPLMRADIEELLAQSALEDNQRPLALRALERSALADLPADLAARRRYDEARLAAANGDREGAQALLAEDESDTGLSVRGALYEQDQQWAQAVQVVGRLASRTLPEQGVLSTAQRDLVIRLASDAAAAGDGPTARSLQAWVGARALGAERQALFTALVRQAQKPPVVSLGVVRVPPTFDKSVKDTK
ncbi:MAG: hypothetical protein ABF436_07065 [Acetobacter okinawensis]|uniref:tetratricopeptide repeat protein n=1 Tax=Acetobacter okinawensis TaxID=1076594 RepID=UPI0039EBC955